MTSLPFKVHNITGGYTTTIRMCKQNKLMNVAQFGFPLTEDHLEAGLEDRLEIASIIPAEKHFRFATVLQSV